MKTEKAIYNDREFVAQVIRALPSIELEIKQGWIENPRGLSEVLAEALCSPEKFVEFPVFKTIKLGTHKSTNDLRLSLKDNGNRIGDWGDEVLGKIALAEFETKITLHVATVKKLAGKDWATNREIDEAILSKGYELCPAEVGPQLRLQYPDQPNGEWIRVAMEPIVDSRSNLMIFSVVRNDDERWLDGCSGHPDDWWNGGCRFMFASRK